MKYCTLLMSMPVLKSVKRRCDIWGYGVGVIPVHRDETTGKIENRQLSFSLLPCKEDDSQTLCLSSTG